MYISSLKIRNYRNFSDFDIELKPFTLIIGENNSGKTNLIEALGLIFSQEITFFKKRTLEIDDVNFDALEKFRRDVSDASKKNKDIEFPEVIIDVTIKEMDPDQRAVAADWFTDKKLSKAQLTYVFRLHDGWKKRDEWINKQRVLSNEKENYRIDFPIKEYEYLIYGGGQPANKAEPYFLKMFKMELLDALRDAKRELVASNEYRLLYKIINNRDDVHFAEIKEGIIELQELLDKNEQLGDVKTDIETYLNKISLQEKNSDNSVKFEFTAPEVGELLKKISLKFGSSPVGIERNGLGRNNLLFISLILSHLSSESTGTSHTFFRLIGVEEPEAHLHPHLQEHLAENIQGEHDGTRQLILSSHSPHIASKLDFESTFILFKDQRGITTKHNISTGIKKGSEHSRYLTKFLDATNSKMFFAKKIILVEGIAEQILIPELFKADKGLTIEKIGCNIVNVQGVAFRHFLEIIKNGYFIKCLVLTDNDKDKKAIKNRAKKLTEDFNKYPTISINETKGVTFEKDIIEANKKGKGKKFILNALQKTRPVKGKAAVEKFKKSDIETEAIFDLIEEYKSEFAFNLKEDLEKNSKDFKIPDYIKNGFNYLMQDE